jgi:ABC-type multidrug transport system fused ATPase/permease subunit
VLQGLSCVLMKLNEVCGPGRMAMRVWNWICGSKRLERLLVCCMTTLVCIHMIIEYSNGNDLSCVDSELTRNVSVSSMKRFNIQQWDQPLSFYVLVPRLLFTELPYFYFCYFFLILFNLRFLLSLFFFLFVLFCFFISFILGIFVIKNLKKASINFIICLSVCLSECENSRMDNVLSWSWY